VETGVKIRAVGVGAKTLQVFVKAALTARAEMG
jgi:hypothetical protein